MTDAAEAHKPDIRSSQIGSAFALLASSDRRMISVAAAYAWLWPPIRLGQIVFLTGRNGRLLGFATWAHVTDRTLEALKMDPAFLDLPDWNEGEHLWIADFVAEAGSGLALAGLLRQRLAPISPTAHALMRMTDKRPSRAREFRLTRS